jgi:hypothetical protein
VSPSTFTPGVIAHLPLTGNTASPDVAAALLDALDVLRELKAAGRTTVPEQATTPATSFVPARWRGYLATTRGQGRGVAYRHYRQLSVLYGVQAGLHSGHLWVARLAPLHRPSHPAATTRAVGRSARRLHNWHRPGPRTATWNGSNASWTALSVSLKGCWLTRRARVWPASTKTAT